MALENAWHFYVHYPAFNHKAKEYGAHANRKLHQEPVKTVEGFWNHFHFLPPPSSALTDLQGQKKLLDQRVPEALGLFKSGVQPEWEDPVNMRGGHWECRVDVGPEHIDRLWSDLVMAMVGETVESKAWVTGGRVVDKCRKGRREFRLELWMQEAPVKEREEIRERLSHLLSSDEFGQAPAFTWKSHSEAIESWKTMG